jgi:hypothetical protein
VFLIMKWIKLSYIVLNPATLHGDKRKCQIAPCMTLGSNLSHVWNIRSNMAYLPAKNGTWNVPYSVELSCSMLTKTYFSLTKMRLKNENTNIYVTCVWAKPQMNNYIHVKFHDHAPSSKTVKATRDTSWQFLIWVKGNNSGMTARIDKRNPRCTLKLCWQSFM